MPILSSVSIDVFDQVLELEVASSVREPDLHHLTLRKITALPHSTDCVLHHPVGPRTRYRVVCGPRPCERRCALVSAFCHPGRARRTSSAICRYRPRSLRAKALCEPMRRAGDAVGATLAAAERMASGELRIARISAVRHPTLPVLKRSRQASCGASNGSGAPNRGRGN